MTSRLNALIISLLLLAWVSIFAPAIALGQPRPPYRRSRAPMTPPSTPTTQQAVKETPQKPDRFFAVTGAVVHTVTGPTLNGATVLTNNGKIVAVGFDVTVPEKTEVLDASGYHLYPGLVAVGSSGLVGNEPPQDNTDVYGFGMTLGLAAGITTAVSGNSAAKMSFGTLEDHFVKSGLFQNFSYSTSNPDGRRKTREQLERVREYLRALDAHEVEKTSNPSATPPKKPTGSDESILKLMTGETTAVASADTAQQIRDLAELAEKYNIRIVVRGAREGWIVAPEMARADMRAILTPRTRADRNDHTNHPNGSSIENARILYDHGVTFAIIPSSTGTSTSGLAGRDLMHLSMEAAFAVRGGLSDDAAIRAITVDAARLLGLDHRIGSVEVGKDADFAIVDGDLLHYMTMVRWAVVNGRIAYDKEQEALLDHIRPHGDRDAPPPPDYWPRSLGDTVPELDLDRPEKAEPAPNEQPGSGSKTGRPERNRGRRG